MRIHSAIVAGALAATIVLGTASTAMAGGGEHRRHSYRHGCSFSAGFFRGEPIVEDGCAERGFSSYDR
ncbi:hypothetical protein [Streptomyces sp. NPDC048650]|uniref:hypothetical protein n=1 Tax=unclassified Streptomyces TaxID=2593676 RepID=UPI003718DAF0